MRISQEILDAAVLQFCADCGLMPAVEGKNRRDMSDGVVRIKKLPRLPEKRYMTDSAHAALIWELLERETGEAPRIYEGMDPFFRAIFCMGRAWMAADERIYDWCEREYGQKGTDPEWFGRISQMQKLNSLLRRHGRTIEDCRLNFLPAERTDGGRSFSPAEKSDGGAPESSFEIRWYEEAELWEIRDTWPFRHALCKTELMPCRLAAAAIRNGEILGMAGAAQDAPLLWQIGVDVRKEWTGRGIGTALVRILKEEVLRRGKIPFYGTVSSHIISIQTALGAGFLPAWTEIYVRKKE